MMIRILLFLYIGVSAVACEGTGDNSLETPKPTSVIADVSPSPTPRDTGRENYLQEWNARYPELKSAISDARAKWIKSEMQSYSFIAKRGTGGVSSSWNRSPVLIKVENGTLVSLEVVDKKDTSIYARTDGFEGMDTIDKLFTFMEQELEKGRLVSGRYDPVLGYPKEVSILYSYGADSWASVHITKFSPRPDTHQ